MAESTTGDRTWSSGTEPLEIGVDLRPPEQAGGQAMLRRLPPDIRPCARYASCRLNHWISIGSEKAFMFSICLRALEFLGSFGAMRVQMLKVDQILYRSTDRDRNLNSATFSRR